MSDLGILGFCLVIAAAFALAALAGIVLELRRPR